MLTLMAMAVAGSAQLSVAPTNHDVVPVKGSAVLNAGLSGTQREAEKIAHTMGARLGKSPRGNVVVAFRKPATNLDEYCFYPIVNSKTGGHMRTFASWQLGLLQGSSRDAAAMPSGEVLLEVSLAPIDGDHTRIEFWSNCMADTELGRVLANSTGKFERAFLAKLAPTLNLDTWSAASSSSADVPAEVEYRAISEFEANDIHRNPLRALHPGVSDKTLVSINSAAPVAEVWHATQAATLRFAEMTGLTVTSIDERFHRIQNGDANIPGRKDWREEFVTTISDQGNGQTRISVVRRLLVPNGATWRGYPSDGEMESWLIGAILRELSAK